MRKNGFERDEIEERRERSRRESLGGNKRGYKTAYWYVQADKKKQDGETKTN